MIKFRYVDGCVTRAVCRKSSVTFPPSTVEPNDSFTIRQIFDNWRKDRPTSVHPFDADFDEDGFDEKDYPDDFSENPIDISQVQNDFDDANRNYVAESQMVKQKQKELQEQKIKEESEKKGAE